MLARSRRLNLTPQGIHSPVIIPSLSSKGFPIIDGKSEVAPILELTHTDIRDAVLVSAYDIHHQFLLHPDALTATEAFLRSPYASPDLLVVDSGGYELATDYESGETARGPREPLEFSSAHFEAVVDALPAGMDILVVSHDAPESSRPTYVEQRIKAQSFFSARKHLRSNFLLKPQVTDRFIRPEALYGDLRNFGVFDVLGVTEKELGGTILERLVCLSRIRVQLDEVGHAGLPIHVFGGLDPLLTPLYFMCGAEIFDGLSWLKYAYHNDVSMHPDAAAVLGAHVDERPERRDQMRHFSNLRFLDQLKRRLQVWVTDPIRFEELGQHHEVLRQIFETVQAQVRIGG